MDSWKDTLVFTGIGFICVLFIIIGGEFGLYPILIIVPIVILIICFWGKTHLSLYNKRESWGIAAGLIAFISILLLLGSCINGCTKRNPDTPRDLEMRYKIWRNNNP